MLRPACLLLAVICLLLLAADVPDDLIRRANAAFLAGDVVAADALYAAAEERSGDPGLVAFNRATILFRRGEFRDAELHYTRTLEDRACPPDRAARAWFNRGTCLVRRGGEAGVYRSAVACFERCLDAPAGDAALKADARHNLELAKLLWADVNRKAAKPETPNAPAPEEKPDPPPKKGGSEPDAKAPDNDTKKTDPKKSQPTPQPQQIPKAGPTDGNAQVPGSNNLPVLPDADPVQPLSPADTRAYLKLAEERLRRERQGLRRTLAGKDPTDVWDW